jgi:hypothetical protein
MLLLVLPAWAQSVPNGDFELLGVGWTDKSVDCFAGSPPDCEPWPGFSQDTLVARGTMSGKLDYAYTYGAFWRHSRALSDPFVVTHTTLSWAESGSHGWLELPGVVTLRTAGPASTDTFKNWQRDLQSACGQTVQVEIEAIYGYAWFDDIVLGGAVCPDFLDADLDGWCPRGTDLDGDGDCAEASELSGGDCDDADPLISQCLTLSFPGWLEAGESSRFTVTGAAPNDLVWLVSSEAEGYSCPAALGGACVDLAEPVTVLGSVRADAAGEASERAPIPSWAPYAPRLFQAVTATGHSLVEQGWIVPANDTPWKRSAPGVPNGNMEDEYGWPPASQGAYDWITGEDPSCPPATYVSAPARGSSALSVGTDDPYLAQFCEGYTHGWPLLVTRSGLRWATVGALGLQVYTMSDGAELPLTVAGPVLADDGFEEFGADLSAACGEAVRIDLTRGSGAAAAVVDNVKLAGPPCPGYVDADGDGLCPSGEDRDGDGACISRGEPDPLPAAPELPMERLLFDFEVGYTAFVTFSDAEVAPHHTRGDRSAYLDPAMGEDWYDAAGEVVTHESLVLYSTTLGVGSWPEAQLILIMSDSGSTLAHATLPVGDGPGVWVQRELDVSAVCGQPFDAVQLLLFSPDWVVDDDGPWLYHNSDLVLVDDVGFAGDPCPTPGTVQDLSE